MNKIKQAPSSSIFKNKKNSSFSPSRSGLQSKITLNPEDDIKTSNANDRLIKMVNFDNGSSLKDCKAILDTMKQEFGEEKQKLALFYRDDYRQLIADLRIDHITINKIFTQKNAREINSKVQRHRIKPQDQIFTNYSKLMKFSLKQNQKRNFQVQEAKRNKSELHPLPSYLSNNQNKQAKTANITFIKEASSVLQKFISQAKIQLTIQSGSKQHFLEKNIRQTMKNRQVCQKVLEEALMFQRYYDVLKKQKAQARYRKSNMEYAFRGKSQLKCRSETMAKSQLNDLSTKSLKNPETSLQKIQIQKGQDQKGQNQNGTGFGYKEQVNRILKMNLDKAQKRKLQQRRDQRIFQNVKIRNKKILQNSKPRNKDSRNGNSFAKVDSKQNSLCTNPKHLRLFETKSEAQNHLQTQEDYVRIKYIQKIKRDEYFKQMNRINDELVEKRNFKNNILIASLLKFIRNNSLEEQLQTPHYAYNLEINDQKPNQPNYNHMDATYSVQKLKQPNKNVNTKGFRQPKQLNGACLTKVLRKLFLIYSFSQAQDRGSAQEPVLLQQNLKRFVSDFQIQMDGLLKNEKTRELITKETIDEFQFIQFIHLLSISLHEAGESQTSQFVEGYIYTNINKMISSKILNQRYANFLTIEEERVVKQKIPHIVQRLKKLNRFDEKLNHTIELFFKSERINKLLIPSIFEDFDYILQALWFLKIYPVHINKKTVRFYHQYLKQQTDSFILGQYLTANHKHKHLIKLENIIWLIVAKVSLDEIRQVQSKNNQSHKTDFNQEKCLQTVFIAKFKILLKSFSK